MAAFARSAPLNVHDSYSPLMKGLDSKSALVKVWDWKYEGMCINLNQKPKKTFRIPIICCPSRRKLKIQKAENRNPFRI